VALSERVDSENPSWVWVAKANWVLVGVWGGAMNSEALGMINARNKIITVAAETRRANLVNESDLFQGERAILA
jgi:hypothetical protein